MFISERRLMAATPKQTLELFDIPVSGNWTSVHTFDKSNGLVIEDGIHLMACSADGSYAAVADHKSVIIILDLNSLGVHSVLPRYKSHPTALAFHPSSTLLVVAYADHKVLSLSQNQMLRN